MIYLDNAAAMRVLPQVAVFLSDYDYAVGNPSSPHQNGQILAARLDIARRNFAKSVKAKPQEVIFTSGATESLFRAIFSFGIGKKKILVSPFCHSAIWGALDSLKKVQAIEIIHIPITKEGIWDFEKLEKLDFDLVIAEWIGSELGIVQPIQKLHEITKKKDKKKAIPVIIDAVAGFVAHDFAFEDFPADVAVLSAEKFGGVAGTGALLIKKGKKSIPYTPFFAGSQEWGARPGTQNLLGIEAMALAAQMYTQKREIYTQKYTELSEQLLSGLEKEKIPLIKTTKASTSPHICHFLLTNSLGATMTAQLDQLGVAVSSSTACQSGTTEPSKALMALNYDTEVAKRGLRVSFGHDSNKEDVENLIKALKSLSV